ncbi:MAG: hypothetical protein ACHQC8_06700 [Solirubrobacterales bacterium]
MSDNYRLHPQKMAELCAAREVNRPLRRQMQALLEVVRECEADRIGRV